MVRAPCCEKMGLKKGPWTQDEDQILISYIQKHGHGNWRALPKLAGLLRCGKSCRLRWINYLKPDIKRGNFSSEEEEIIIKMHELMGNRWSAIAAKLPGRTDNEIKNVWHTHLKKKLLNSNTKSVVSNSKIKRSDSNSSTITQSSSACTSSSDFSSFSEENKNMNNSTMIKSEDIESEETTMPPIDESFWSEETVEDESSTMIMPSNSWTISNELAHSHHQYQFNSVETFQQHSFGYNGSNFDDGMDFWYDIFIKSEESMELPQF